MSSKGLYTKELEHDSCGVGCVADITNKPSHKTVKDALTMLENMEHRGATGSDENTGDGAGILVAAILVLLCVQVPGFKVLMYFDSHVL